MKETSRSPVRKNDGFQRYLKPGALAQIRNSRINSRSTSLVSRSITYPIDPHSPSQNSAAEAEAARNVTIEQVPHLLRKIYGPFSYQRKKLGAARSVSSLMMVNLNNPINSVIDTNGGNSSVLSSDVIAH